MTLEKKALENTEGKEKMLVISISSFSYSVFYSIIEKNLHLNII